MCAPSRQPFEPDTSASMWGLREGAPITNVGRTPEAVLKSVADRTCERMRLSDDDMRQISHCGAPMGSLVDEITAVFPHLGDAVLPAPSRICLLYTSPSPRDS